MRGISIGTRRLLAACSTLALTIVVAGCGQPLATTPSAWRPTGGEASPLAVSFVHVAPPSLDLKTAGSRVNGGPPAGGASPGRIGLAIDAPLTPTAGYNDA